MIQQLAGLASLVDLIRTVGTVDGVCCQFFVDLAPPRATTPRLRSHAKHRPEDERLLAADADPASKQPRSVEVFGDDRNQSLFERVGGPRARCVTEESERLY